jgi:hypothetical protein
MSDGTDNHDESCEHCGGAPDPSTLPEQYVYARMKATMWRNATGGLLLALAAVTVLAVRYGLGAAFLAAGVAIGNLLLGRWWAWGEQRSSDLMGLILVRRPELIGKMFGESPQMITLLVATQCHLLQTRCKELLAKVV